MTLVLDTECILGPPNTGVNFSLKQFPPDVYAESFIFLAELGKLKDFRHRSRKKGENLPVEEKLVNRVKNLEVKIVYNYPHPP